MSRFMELTNKIFLTKEELEELLNNENVGGANCFGKSDLFEGWIWW